MRLLQETQFIHDTMERVVVHCSTLRNFMNENLVALQAVLADLKITIENFSAYEV